MRITNHQFVNPEPIVGAYQPHISWGYSSGPYTRPDATNAFFTNKPVGSLYVYNAALGTTYATQELWVKVNNAGFISDWRCVSGVLTARISVADFTDGGSTAGTLALTNTVPAGAFILGSTVRDVVGFAGDTTATLTIGDGSDVDRYNTGTFNVFATAVIPASVTTQNAPSGNRGTTAGDTVTITVTTSADFTSCKSNGAGRATVSIWYLL